MKITYKIRPPLDGRNCAVREHTADGVSVGRCWHWVGNKPLTEATCPRHGDVSAVQRRYAETGELTNDTELKR